MPRTLSVARARVAVAQQAEWLAVVARLAGLLARRGHHLWVFRSERDPDLWLEFSEASDRAAHRAVAPRAAEEAELEARLQQLARYESDPSALWTEVPLPKES